MKSSTLKVITIIVAVVGLVGGIILGSKFKTIDLTSYRVEEHFNATLMITVWIGTALYAAPCFALASILENQDYIADEIRKQNQTLRSPNREAVNVAVSNSKMNLSAVASGNSSDSAWTCPDCGETNPRNIRVCKSCGYEK